MSARDDVANRQSAQASRPPIASHYPPPTLLICDQIRLSLPWHTRLTDSSGPPLLATQPPRSPPSVPPLKTFSIFNRISCLLLLLLLRHQLPPHRPTASPMWQPAECVTRLITGIPGCVPYRDAGLSRLPNWTWRLVGCQSETKELLGLSEAQTLLL